VGFQAPPVNVPSGRRRESPRHCLNSGPFTR
jgi:hypothetical protein